MQSHPYPFHITKMVDKATQAASDENTQQLLARNPTKEDLEWLDSIDCMATGMIYDNSEAIGSICEKVTLLAGNPSGDQIDPDAFNSRDLVSLMQQICAAAEISRLLILRRTNAISVIKNIDLLSDPTGEFEDAKNHPIQHLGMVALKDMPLPSDQSETVSRLKTKHAMALGSSVFYVDQIINTSRLLMKIGLSVGISTIDADLLPKYLLVNFVEAIAEYNSLLLELQDGQSEAGFALANIQAKENQPKAA